MVSQHRWKAGDKTPALGPAPWHRRSRGGSLTPRLTSTCTHSTAEEFTHRASKVLSVPKWHSRAVSWEREDKGRVAVAAVMCSSHLSN